MCKAFFFVAGSLVVMLLAPVVAYCRQPDLQTYAAQYEKGPGSTIVDLSLKNKAPITNSPFLLITGVKYKNCGPEGMPSKQEADHLSRIADSVQAWISKPGRNIYAGTYTYQCERTAYYYLVDSNGIRAKLKKLYAQSFPGYEVIINLKRDILWDEYLKFLYPSDETMEYIQNQKILVKLTGEGDKLDKPRRVDHWVYFISEADRDCFITYATKNNYQVALKEKAINAQHPFKLQLFRTDHVDIHTISAITLALRDHASRCNGTYDKWETVVVK